MNVRGKLPPIKQETVRRIERDEGQTMAEYAVVLGVITLAIVTTIATLSDGIRGLFEQAVGVFS
jgi:Flp pilus assembly pilin Flp